MEERRYQEVLEEHARLTRHPVRAVLLLLIAIALGLIFGPTPPPGFWEGYLMDHLACCRE